MVAQRGMVFFRIARKCSIIHTAIDLRFQACDFQLYKRAGTTMKKIKVGDKVKIVYQPRKTSGKVIEISSDGWYFLQGRGWREWFKNVKK